MKHIVIGIFGHVMSNSFALAETTVQCCNRSVTVDAPPSRAISNDVYLTEMMLVLGLAERMVRYTGISGRRTLDEEMRDGAKELPELSAKYLSKAAVLLSGGTVRPSPFEQIISIRRLSQYRSSLSDRAAADLAALDSVFVRMETSIFRLGKR